jgi:hypothetical protein
MISGRGDNAGQTAPKIQYAHPRRPQRHASYPRLGMCRVGDVGGAPLLPEETAGSLALLRPLLALPVRLRTDRGGNW